MQVQGCHIHLLEAVRLVSRHGRALNNKEKRRAVYQLLRDFPETEMSSRQLAEVVGVRHNLVAQCRRELQAGGPAEKGPGRGRGPEQYAKRLLRAFDGLKAAMGASPAGPCEVGAALAQAAFAQYPDADPARELQLLAVGALEGCEHAGKKMLRAPGPPQEVPAEDLAAAGGHAL